MGYICNMYIYIYVPSISPLISQSIACSMLYSNYINQNIHSHPWAPHVFMVKSLCLGSKSANHQSIKQISPAPQKRLQHPTWTPEPSAVRGGALHGGGSAGHGWGSGFGGFFGIKKLWRFEMRHQKLGTQRQNWIDIWLMEFEPELNLWLYQQNLGYFQENRGRRRKECNPTL